MFDQVCSADAINWPQPWKSMYHRLYYDEDSDLYDSEDYETEEEDSFEALCRFESQTAPSTSCNSLDSWFKTGRLPHSC